LTDTSIIFLLAKKETIVKKKIEYKLKGGRKGGKCHTQGEVRKSFLNFRKSASQRNGNNYPHLSGWKTKKYWTVS